MLAPTNLPKMGALRLWAKTQNLLQKSSPQKLPAKPGCPIVFTRAFVL